MMYAQMFLVALACTVLIEVPIVWLLITRAFTDLQIPTHRIIFAGMLATGLTLPYLWFILPVYFTNHAVYVYGGEALVMAVEAVIYRHVLGVSFPRAAIISIVANVSSVLIGLLLPL